MCSSMFINVRLSCLASLCLGVAALQAAAGSALAQSAVQDADAAPGALIMPSAPIGPDDLLNITVYGVPALSRRTRVSGGGDIDLPMLAQPIRAEGLRPTELEPVIAKAFVSSEILVDPVITVTVVEYRSRPITVSGAVKKPLTFQETGKTTLLDAIAKADGLSDAAGPEILVTAPRKEGSDEPGKTTHIPVEELIGGKRPDLNLMLTGGEEVRVPEIGRFFVLGNVTRPGEFPIQKAAETSVLKALALSQGLSPFASKVAYIYRDEGSAAKRLEIPVALQKILDRKSPDVALEANDILYIPDDKHRRMTATTIDRIVTFGAGTASGVLIWRR